ncbi:MAG: glycosyltransferase, partial [Caldisericia bacterium]|nr:glycosyltransferase [Caldisericia bacterium]
MNSKVVLIGAGGTGGHVIPAMSISKQLLKDGFHPIIVGSGKILEIVKKTGIETIQIETASPSPNPMKAMKFLKKLK